MNKLVKITLLLLMLTFSSIVPAYGDNPVGTCISGNCVSGRGKYFTGDGDYYEGRFVKGVFAGKGKLTLSTGHVYQGRFEGWLIDYGTLSFPGGKQSYTGKFKDLRPHGIGKFVYEDGSVYAGDWVNGDKSGTGQMNYSDGTVYTGGWINNVWNGEGSFFNGEETVPTHYTNGIKDPL